MNLPLFYEKFTDTNHITFSEASAHHALHVLRMKTGDRLIVTNGQGMMVECVLDQQSKRDCSIQIVRLLTSETGHRTSNLHLAIAFTKNPARIEWLLEKATEIGVQTITPLITKRSEKIHFKRERFEKILVSAMLQSQQCYLPILNEATPIEEILKGSEEVKLIAHCEEDGKRVHLNECVEPNKNTLILIGPEGDFTMDEINLCLGHNCKPVLLGNHRLRTETAGLFACVVFNSQIAAL